jgi:hypothetical protein
MPRKDRSASRCAVNFGLFIGTAWNGLWITAWVKWHDNYLKNDWASMVLTAGIWVNFAVFVAGFMLVLFLRAQHKVLVMRDEIEYSSNLQHDDSHLYAVGIEDGETLDVQLELDKEEQQVPKKSKKTKKAKKEPEVKAEEASLEAVGNAVKSED